MNNNMGSLSSELKKFISKPGKTIVPLALVASTGALGKKAQTIVQALADNLQVKALATTGKINDVAAVINGAMNDNGIQASGEQINQWTQETMQAAIDAAAGNRTASFDIMQYLPLILVGGIALSLVRKRA
jgi:1-deoxy-D-xylulose 5-phosphate reductoisomerase